MELGGIRGSLVDLEWVRKFSDFRGYSQLWVKKQTALKEDDLESIENALEATQQIAGKWKDARKREIDSAFKKIERMLKSIDKDSLKKESASLEEKKQSINWDKPDLESLYRVLYQVDNLRNQLRAELINKVQSEDAISMIEEPELIEDFGEKKGWDFERFIKALEVVLRNGLIEIRVVEGE